MRTEARETVAAFPVRSRYITFLLIAGLGLTWDLLSKWWVFRELGYPYHGSDWRYECSLLWGRFSIQFFTSFNRGALWGMGQGHTGLFALLSLLAATFIVYWLFVRGEARSLWLTVTLGLIMAGTLGNLFDRLWLHGCTGVDGRPEYGVRDFIACFIPMIGYKFPFEFWLIPAFEWPIFNFADTYLITGAILLAIQALFIGDGAAEVAATPPAPTTSATTATKVAHTVAPRTATPPHA